MLLHRRTNVREERTVSICMADKRHTYSTLKMDAVSWRFCTKLHGSAAQKNATLQIKDAHRRARWQIMVTKCPALTGFAHSLATLQKQSLDLKSRLHAHILRFHLSPRPAPRKTRFPVIAFPTKLLHAFKAPMLHSKPVCHLPTLITLCEDLEMMKHMNRLRIFSVPPCSLGTCLISTSMSKTF